MEAKVRCTSPICSKLLEAKLFLEQMGLQVRDFVGFRYYVSAFLSALRSCTEHKRMFSTDSRFPEWHRNNKNMWTTQPDLSRLAELRNKEVHHVGTTAKHEVFFEVPESIGKTNLYTNIWEGGRVQFMVADVFGQVHKCDFTVRWIWNVPGNPEVMELCERGLKAMRGVVAVYDVMDFSGLPADIFNISVHSSTIKPPSDE